MIARILSGLFLYGWLHQRGMNVILRRIIALQEEEIAKLKLEHSRWGLSMLEQFIIALDNPEIEDDLRAKLWDAIFDMRDEVARTEEHATS